MNKSFQLIQIVKVKILVPYTILVSYKVALKINAPVIIHLQKTDLHYALGENIMRFVTLNHLFYQQSLAKFFYHLAFCFQQLWSK